MADIQKITHELGGILKGGHLHLSLLAGIFGLIQKPKVDSRAKIGDPGDLGDNMPYVFLSTLRKG